MVGSITKRRTFNKHKSRRGHYSHTITTTTVIPSTTSGSPSDTMSGGMMGNVMTSSRVVTTAYYNKTPRTTKTPAMASSTSASQTVSARRSQTTTAQIDNIRDSSSLLGATSILGIMAGLLVVCVIVGVVLYCFCRQRRKSKSTFPNRQTETFTSSTIGDNVYLGHQVEMVSEESLHHQSEEGITLNNNNKVTYTKETEYAEISEVEGRRGNPAPTPDGGELVADDDDDGTYTMPRSTSDYDLPETGTDTNQCPTDKADLTTFVPDQSSRRKGSTERPQPAPPKITPTISSKVTRDTNGYSRPSELTTELKSPTTKKAILPPMTPRPNTGSKANSNTHSPANSTNIRMDNPHTADVSSRNGNNTNNVTTTNLKVESYYSSPRQRASLRTDSGIDCNYIGPSSLDELESPSSPDEQEDNSYYAVPSSLCQDSPTLRNPGLHPIPSSNGNGETTRSTSYVVSGDLELTQRSPTDKEDLQTDYTNVDVFQQKSALEDDDNNNNDSDESAGEDSDNVYEIPSELENSSPTILVRARMRSARAKKLQLSSSPLSAKEMEASGTSTKNIHEPRHYVHSPTAKALKESESLGDETAGDDTGNYANNYINSWIAQPPIKSDTQKEEEKEDGIKDADDDTGSYVNNYVNAPQLSNFLETSTSSSDTTGNYVNSRIPYMPMTDDEPECQENEYHVAREFYEKIHNKDNKGLESPNRPASLPKPHRTLASIQRQIPNGRSHSQPALFTVDNPHKYHTLQNQESESKANNFIKSPLQKKMATLNKAARGNAYSTPPKPQKALLPPGQSSNSAAKKPRTTLKTAKGSVSLIDSADAQEPATESVDNLYVNSQELQNIILKESTK